MATNFNTYGVSDPVSMYSGSTFNNIVPGPAIQVGRPGPRRPGIGGATAQTDHAYSTRNWKDPRSAEAYSFLEHMMRGTVGPYDSNTKANMLAKASEMNAGAAAQQGAALRRATGATLVDPSMRAGLQRAEMQRQGANLGAAMDIEAMAAPANFAARVSGADRLAAYDPSYSWADDDDDGLPNLFAGRSDRKARPRPLSGFVRFVPNSNNNNNGINYDLIDNLWGWM